MHTYASNEYLEDHPNASSVVGGVGRSATSMGASITWELPVTVNLI